MTAPDTDKELEQPRDDMSRVQMSEQHPLIDEPVSARDERREGMMMTTPYPNYPEPNSYPGRCPSLLPPITTRCPSLLLTDRIRVNPQEKHHSVAVLPALSSSE